MEISKYIQWDEIWSEEVCPQTSIDCLNEDDVTEKKIINVINRFISDKEVTLNFDECSFNIEHNGNVLIFFFCETGGQNESDAQGWSREYIFVVNEDFFIIDAEYRQG